jgi:hypothetical protein
LTTPDAAVEHAPAMHVSPDAHATVAPHARPQVAGESKFVSQPSSEPEPTSALQSPKLGLQVGAQAPVEQAVAEALALLQVRPQALQFVALLTMLVSQPSSVPEPVSTLQS